MKDQNNKLSHFISLDAGSVKHFGYMFIEDTHNTFVLILCSLFKKRKEKGALFILGS